MCVPNIFIDPKLLNLNLNHRPHDTCIGGSMKPPPSHPHWLAPVLAEEMLPEMRAMGFS